MSENNDPRPEPTTPTAGTPTPAQAETVPLEPLEKAGSEVDAPQSADAQPTLVLDEDLSAENPAEQDRAPQPAAPATAPASQAPTTATAPAPAAQSNASASAAQPQYAAPAAPQPQYAPQYAQPSHPHPQQAFPVQPYVQPVQQHPQPVQPYPQPVQQHPQPVQPYPQPGYAQTAYRPPAYVRMIAQPTNSPATAALVLGIIACVLLITIVGFMFVPILSILAIIFGCVGIGSASKVQGFGKGKAITGLVLGVVPLVILIIAFWGFSIWY